MLLHTPDSRARWRYQETTRAPKNEKKAGYLCACFWPSCQKQILRVWHVGWTSSCGTCAHSPAPCSLIDICKSTLGWQVRHWRPAVFRWSSHWANVTGVKESRDAALNVKLPVTSSSMMGLAVSQWRSVEAHPWRIHVIANGTLIAVRCRDEILRATVRS